MKSNELKLMPKVTLTVTDPYSTSKCLTNVWPFDPKYKYYTKCLRLSFKKHLIQGPKKMLTSKNPSYDDHLRIKNKVT
jgi:hypothetical protein